MTGSTESRLCRLSELVEVIEQAAGFGDVLAALRAGHAGTVDGAWGSCCALVAAALARQAPATLVVVAAHIADLEDLRDDLVSFSGGAPEIFPAWDLLPPKDLVGDETYGRRLRLLKRLAGPEPPRIVLAPIQALMQPVPSLDAVDRESRMLRAGQSITLEDLLRWLVDRGFVRRDAVDLPGEISLRGGILDVFPPDLDGPVRIEFFGDTIESIRSFDIETQRSTGTLAELLLTAAQLGRSADDDAATSGESARSSHFTSYVPPDTWFVLIEPPDLQEQGHHYLQRLDQRVGLFTVEGCFKQILAFSSIVVSRMPSSSMEATCHLQVESIERFSGELSRMKRELDDVARQDQVLIACHNAAEVERLREIFASSEIARAGRLHFDVGQVRAGFRVVWRGPAPADATERSAVPPPADETQSLRTALVVLSDHELFRRETVRRPAPRRRYESRAIDSFLDLEEGDYVVHISHGIGIYRGMEVTDRCGTVEEHLVIEFAEGTRVGVPASKIELVQKYVGGSKVAPALSRVGSITWENRKNRVARAVEDLASELLDLQATRESQPGEAYPADSDWQLEFEAAFPYQETPDQTKAMDEIRQDMSRTRPMDRLICGDVGYGKTELAMRAAFKIVDNGRQVAVLVPTTVLAEQHYRTFTERMAEFPFAIDVLSRFKTRSEQQKTIERLAAGQLDIVIGTHRLVQDDVRFHDLGLVIIDEEQRFGVEHKEKLKALRRTVEVLTLTATPIPRTLHMSLLGIRDISTLETPPQDRQAIETRITRFDDGLLRHAILRELNRDGQVFFVHNRVQDIGGVADRLQRLVPEARILIGHGQMPEHQLEDTMREFVQHRGDILVCTTIIESGLDIPRANTIFINDADRFGLADIHQLRGRVGRYKHRAYAYLLVDAARRLTQDAAKRLKAIEEFSDLGAGFRIALRDLEIRGAGNILGAQQSGHIAAVGYELYCQLLENAVRQLKKQPLRTRLDVAIELPWRVFLPRDYVPGLRQKIELYRRLARIHELDEVAQLRQELTDRFGPPPPSVANMLATCELRILAQRWQIGRIRYDGQYLVLEYRDATAIAQLVQRSRQDLRVADATSAYLPAGAGTDGPQLADRLKQLLGDDHVPQGPPRGAGHRGAARAGRGAHRR